MDISQSLKELCISIGLRDIILHLEMVQALDKQDSFSRSLVPTIVTGHVLKTHDMVV